MSDEDLKELETTTTNITDDIKANLQKINKSKSIGKLTVDTVKKRNKRYSCILPTECSNLPIPTSFKRRSLNINQGETSKIPVSFRNKRSEELPSETKRENISIMSNKNDNLRLKTPSRKLHTFEPLNTKENTEKTATIESDNNTCVNENEPKPNIPLNSIKINVPINTKNRIPTKASGLPILTR